MPPTPVKALVFPLLGLGALAAVEDPLVVPAVPDDAVADYAEVLSDREYEARVVRLLRGVDLAAWNPGRVQPAFGLEVIAKRAPAGEGIDPAVADLELGSLFTGFDGSPVACLDDLLARRDFDRDQVLEGHRPDGTGFALTLPAGRKLGVGSLERWVPSRGFARRRAKAGGLDDDATRVLEVLICAERALADHDLALAETVLARARAAPCQDPALHLLGAELAKRRGDHALAFRRRAEVQARLDRARGADAAEALANVRARHEAAIAGGWLRDALALMRDRPEAFPETGERLGQVLDQVLTDEEVDPERPWPLAAYGSGDLTAVDRGADLAEADGNRIRIASGLAGGEIGRLACPQNHRVVTRYSPALRGPLLRFGLRLRPFGNRFGPFGNAFAVQFRDAADGSLVGRVEFEPEGRVETHVANMRAVTGLRPIPREGPLLPCTVAVRGARLQVAVDGRTVARMWLAPRHRAAELRLEFLVSGVRAEVGEFSWGNLIESGTGAGDGD